MPTADFPSLGGRLAHLLAWSACWALLAAALIALVTFGWAHRQAAPGHHFAPDEPRARRYLRIAFGCLWIVDGLLQAQPRMPAGFVPADIEPELQDSPGWLVSMVEPLTRAWVRHPVVADVAVISVEIGLGLLLLAGGRRWFARATLMAALAAGLAIWVFGEAFGGLFSAGASWLTGAPGAALVYVAAGGVLLLPWTWWTDGRAARTVRWIVGGWFLGAAVLESIPAEGFWKASSVAAPFAAGAAMDQPSWLNAPMQPLADFAAANPVTVNLTVVLVVAATGAWLLVDKHTRAVTAGLVLCAATWWLAQDFGVLGGTATDPGAGLPLGLLLAAALPTLSVPAAAPVDAASRSVRSPALAVSLRAGVAGLGAVLVLALPVTLANTVRGPADSDAVAADSGGGVQAVPHRLAPAFDLVDQRGQRVSTEQLRGKLVVLTFLDPVCTSDCPVIANQLAIADRELGVVSHDVEFVAIDSNPVFYRVADVAAFTDSHGLSDLANWHFLTGPVETTQDTLARYGITVDVPTVGMIEHSEGLFFITADGRLAAYLDDRANAELTDTYAEQVQRQIRDLLP